MTGPAVCILLVSAVVLAWFYPLSRERQTRIQRLLHRRRQRQQKVRPVVAPKSPAYGGN
jgi:Na+/melibiose symporter-like transporter